MHLLRDHMIGIWYPELGIRSQQEFIIGKSVISQVNWLSFGKPGRIYK